MKKLCSILLCIVVCLCSAVVSAGQAAGDATVGFRAEYSYPNNSLTVTATALSTQSTSGALYVVPRGTSMDSLTDENLPIAADVVSIANGALSETYFFADDFPHGYYEVYLYTEDTIYQDAFSYLSESERIRERKEAIFKALSESDSWMAMKSLFLGEDEDGNSINDNLSYIQPDMTVYNQLKNVNALWQELYRRKSKAQNLDDVAALFETIAKERRAAERSSSSSGTSGGSGSSGSGGGSGRGTRTQEVIRDYISPTPKVSFADLDGHWAAEYAKQLGEKSIISGYEDGSFRPDAHITRAEFIKLIVSVFNFQAQSTGGFTDVSEDDWFAPYVNAAANCGIVVGENNQFRPNDMLSRQDAAVILYRSLSVNYSIEEGYVFFADEVDIAEYSSDAIRALAQQSIINGMNDGCFMPKSAITRAETAALVCRTLDYISAH